MDVEWDTSKEIGDVLAKLDVHTVDEPLLLSNVSKVIGGHGVNISEVTSSHLDRHAAVMHFHLQVNRLDQLDAIIRDLKTVKGVTQVHRVRR
ncbi:MAG: hypothetical protein M5R36_22080 [Deltaproteobacteria bacterium]|nr:hypothetical protein [Deltaproteobacteria bacterium]